MDVDVTEWLTEPATTVTLFLAHHGRNERESFDADATRRFEVTFFDGESVVVDFDTRNDSCGDALDDRVGDYGSTASALDDRQNRDDDGCNQSGDEDGKLVADGGLDAPAEDDRVTVTFDSRYSSREQTLHGDVRSAKQQSAHAWKATIDPDERDATIRLYWSAHEVTIKTVESDGGERTIGDCGFGDVSSFTPMTDCGRSYTEEKKQESMGQAAARRHAEAVNKGEKDPGGTVSSPVPGPSAATSWTTESTASPGSTASRTSSSTRRTTYGSASGNSVHPGDDDLVIGVIWEDYDFLDRVVDRHIPALGPPKPLLRSFKRVEENAEADGEPEPTRIAWKSVNFRFHYLEHIETTAAKSVEAIRQALETGRNVWLVCLESEEAFCHRRLLAAHVRQEEPAHWEDLTTPW